MLSLPPCGELTNTRPPLSPARRCPVQHFAGDLDPVVHERRLHLRDGGTLRPEMRVSPVRGILRMPRPFVRDADAAGETDAAVDDEELAMRAVVEAMELVPAGLVEATHLDTRELHERQLALVHLAAAEPVEQQMHANAGAGPVGERIGERLADFAGPVDVALETDRLLRAADRAEHRREDLVTVAQHLEAVAVHDRRSEQDAHRTPELWIARGVKAHDVVLDLLFARLKVENEQSDDERCEYGDRSDGSVATRHGSVRCSALNGSGPSISCAASGPARRC
jgi:hypothetical protein